MVKEWTIIEQIRPHIRSIGIVNVAGRAQPYLVLAAEAKPEHPEFSGYRGDALVVSERVPLEFREFFLVHEWHERHEFHGRPDRCRLAMWRELELVPEGMLPRYIPYRIAFFQRALELARRDGDKALTQEIAAALDDLKTNCVPSE